jgi:hypothetical protein
MLHVEHEKWNQTLSDLRHEAVYAKHPRTRERFMALYEIANGGTNAVRWADDNDRHFQSVWTWIHSYNERGPAGVVFRHAGGWTPLFVRKPAH